MNAGDIARLKEHLERCERLTERVAELRTAMEMITAETHQAELYLRPISTRNSVAQCCTVLFARRERPTSTARVKRLLMTELSEALHELDMIEPAGALPQLKATCPSPLPTFEEIEAEGPHHE